MAESRNRLNLDLIIATRYWAGWGKCVMSWMDTASSGHIYTIVGNKDVLPAFQEGYEVTRGEILGYLHDDLVIEERGWDQRVLEQFEDPTVGVVGFAGARGHGTANLYTSAYHLPNLARQQFMSNMKDAEHHGQRFAGERDVAVLDGMAIFVRRPILDNVHGWPVDKPIGYWLYSEWLCCEARRQGYRIRVVGVGVDHLGGKSSGFINPSISYEEAHKYLWETSRDVLPYRVPDENLSDNSAERVPAGSARIRFPGDLKGGGRA